MSAARLPHVGIIVGPVDHPKATCGLEGWPPGVSLWVWLEQLRSEGCNVRVSPIGSFEGTFVECAADGRCQRWRDGRCPLPLAPATIGQTED